MNVCLATMILMATVTGYSADVARTDDRPTETASGKQVEIGMVACPSKYPFGTKIEIYGQEYTCEDRMNKRYRDGDYFDIYFNDVWGARAFGRQTLEVKVTYQK